MWMSMDGEGTKWRGNITENFNRLNSAYELCRRETDDRRTDDDLTFTFANNIYIQSNRSRCSKPTPTE